MEIIFGGKSVIKFYRQPSSLKHTCTMYMFPNVGAYYRRSKELAHMAVLLKK